MKIHAHKLHTANGWEYNQVLTVQGDTVISIEDAEQVNPSSIFSSHNTIIPGLIDIQVNGGGDVLFNQTPTSETLVTMFNAHQQFGTCAMLPTLITDSFDKMQAAAEAVANSRKQNTAGILGLHFEGPWLHSSRKGVHEERFIRAPIERELQLLRRSDIGKVMVTLAPENVPTAVINEMAVDGIIVFLGHSNASAEQVDKAIEAGAIGFTHLFNAMSPMQSRAPGMVGSALANDSCYAGLIVDGHHVDPLCCKIAFRAKGKDKLILVTDAMALAASSNTEVDFFDTVIRKQHGKLSTPDGTLAGSCLTMIEAVKNAVSACQISLYESIYMASAAPAKLLNLSDLHGTIKAGTIANLLSVDDSCNIQQIWHHGHSVNKRRR